MLPSPTPNSVPPPGDIVKLVQDTATSAVTTVVDKASDVAGLPKKAPASPPTRTPSAKPPLHLPSRPADVARSAVYSAPASWSLFSATGQADRLPELPTGLTGPAALTPVVAGNAGTAPTQLRSAGSTAALAERGTSVMRGVLIALAAASAATLAMAHVTALRGSGRR